MTQGQRLSELLELKFKRQADAATYFGVNQPAISIWKSKVQLSERWYKTYSPMLKDVGLNPEYLKDEMQPKLIVDGVDQETINSYIESLQEEIKRLKLAAQAIATDRYINQQA